MNAANLPVSKDPAFKLFGRKIPVPDSPIPPKDSCSELTNLETEGHDEDNSGGSNKPLAQGKGENSTPIQVNEAQISSKLKVNEAETTSTEQEKVVKKPDKILPCPRCNSFETKFCYFNNYNVNQPRHFCKNCQRYWTAGGTMRNVPIGAGRRKNKHLASQYRQLLVSSDGMPINGMENSDSANHRLMASVESAAAVGPSSGNAMVLKFGPEAPLCESMDTALNIGDQNRYSAIDSVNCQNKGEEPSSRGSSTIASSVRGSELPENVVQKEQVCAPGPSNEPNASNSRHCYPAPSFMFPWDPSWNHVASMAAAQYSSGHACIINGKNPNQVQWCPTPLMAVPSFCPPSIPVQVIPASYWGCMPMWAGGTGNLSLSGSNGCLSPPSSTSTRCCSGNGSPTLGKHSRDSKFLDEEKAEKFVLVPKTLRIDDPNEAQKSPLWATLGFKTDLKGPTTKDTATKAYETKGVGNDNASDTSYILEANPAALSRSHTFQESS